MPNVKILTESDLRELVTLDVDVIDCVEEGFKALSAGEVVMPPILSMPIAENNGEVDVKTAHVTGSKSFAIKMSPGFFDNPKIGLPSTSGLMVLFSAKTGMLEALLLDNGYLTDIRTAAAGAVAARLLAPESAEKACIMGAGTQAKLQLKALCLVRPITSATIWARDKVKAEICASALTEELTIPVEAVADPEAALRVADVVITTTPASEPIVQAEWLSSGQHITAVGSDQEHKNELSPACLARADLYVPDRRTQTERLGELRAALAAGVLDDNIRSAELGSVASGQSQGRNADSDLTIADLTGTGMQDTLIATLARERAATLGMGVDFKA